MSELMVEAKGLQISYGWGRGAVRIVHGVDFAVERGRTLGVVGESGSGKSTIAKALVGSLRPSGGSVRVAGLDLASASRQQRAELRRRVQLIPQDPYSSLNPRRTIGQALAEALDPRGANVARHREKIQEWLEVVRMPADTIDRYPHQFSGGQRQRIAKARGLIREPDVVIADEITAALDVSVLAEILTLLARIRAELDLTMVFISHNLAVVQEVADDILVLLHGEAMESGPVDEVFAHPSSAYTRKLLSAGPGGPGFDIGAGVRAL